MTPHLPGLAQMRAAAKPGECIFCGDPAIPLSDKPSARSARKRRGITRTHRDTCGSEVCFTARFKYWRRDARHPPQPVHHVVVPMPWRARRRIAQSRGLLWRNAA